MCDNYLPYVSESVWKGSDATRNPSKPFLRHKVHIRVKGKGFKGAGRQWERAHAGGDSPVTSRDVFPEAK